MTMMKRTIVLYPVLWLLCSSLWAAPLPIQPFEATYTVYWRGLLAARTYHLLTSSQKGDFWFTTKTEPSMGLLPYHYDEATHFRWNHATQTIVPLYFEYQHQEGSKHRATTIAFDWKHHTLGPSKKGAKRWPQALKAGTQNKLTYGLMLRLALKKQAKKFHYTVADDDTLKEMEFKIIGHELSPTPYGEVHTQIMNYVSPKGRETRIWFAKELDYVPIKLQQYKNGKLQTEAILEKYEVTGG